MILVIGSSSTLGEKVIKHISDLNESVIAVARSNQFDQSEAGHVHYLNSGIGDPDLYSKIDSICLNNNEQIESIVFLQRYRPEDKDCYSLNNALEVEVTYPVDMVHYYARKRSLSSVLFVSSILAELVDLEVDIGYHIVKSSILTACKYLSTKYAEKSIDINVALLGYVSPFENSTNEKRSIHRLDEVILKNRNGHTIEKISSQVAHLCLPHSLSGTSNIYRLDNTLMNLSAAYVAKTMFNSIGI